MTDLTGWFLSAPSCPHHKLACAQDTEDVCLILILLLVVHHRSLLQSCCLRWWEIINEKIHTPEKKWFWGDYMWHYSNFRGWRCLLQEATWLYLLSLFRFSVLNQNLTIFLYFNTGFWNSNIGGCAYLTWKERKSGRYSTAGKTKQKQKNPHTNTKGHPPLVTPFPYK